MKMKTNSINIKIKIEPDDSGTINMFAAQEGKGNLQTRWQQTQHSGENTQTTPDNLSKKPRKSMWTNSNQKLDVTCTKQKAAIKNLKLIKFKVSFKINKETPADSLKVHYIH